MSTTTSIADKVDRRRRILIASLHPDYFWSKALADGTFTLKIGSGVGTNRITSISYSLDDGRTWVTTQNVNSTAVTITTPTVLTGNKVLWKGEAVGMAYSYSNNNYSTFTGSAEYEIGGNISSLLYGDNMLAQQYNAFTTDCTFFGLFQSNARLKSAGDLVLPTKRITTSRSYQQMFYQCSNLTTPPKILLETFTGQYVMGSMFNACSNLETAPNLVVNSCTRECCRGMFYGCAKITRGIDLLALTLAQSCYYEMYRGCSSLTYIKMMATDISASSALNNWVYGVDSAGTFVKNANAQWTLPTGASGIPTNFTVTSESE